MQMPCRDRTLQDARQWRVRDRRAHTRPLRRHVVVAGRNTGGRTGQLEGNFRWKKQSLLCNIIQAKRSGKWIAQNAEDLRKKDIEIRSSVVTFKNAIVFGTRLQKRYGTQTFGLHFTSPIGAPSSSPACTRRCLTATSLLALARWACSRTARSLCLLSSGCADRR